MADSIHQTHPYGVSQVAHAAGITPTGLRKSLLKRIERMAPHVVVLRGQNDRGAIYGFSKEAIEIAESYRDRGPLTPDQWEAQWTKAVEAEVVEPTGSALAVLPQVFRQQADHALDVAREDIWDYQAALDSHFQAELQAAFEQGERESGMLLSAKLAGRQSGMGKLLGDRAAAAQGGA